MSNPEERQAGTPGSPTPGARPGGTATSRGAEYGQGTGAQKQGAGYQPGTAGFEQGQAAAAEYYPRHEMRRGERGAVVGGTVAAGTLMILSGLWNIAVGIASLSALHVYVATPAPGYTYRWSLTGWGWGLIGLGIVVFAAGVCVFLGMAWARYFGAVLAVISAVASFLYIPFQPFWSIGLIILDAFIIWALLAPRREPGQL